MSRRHKVAILGAGIGGQHLSALLNLADRFQVTAICDLDAGRADALTAAQDGIRTETEIAKIMADPAIDVVDICLPPHLHFPVAMEAIAAGKNVVCEKPLAGSLREADQLIAAARANGCAFSPVFQYRYGLAMAQLDALIAAGLAGRAFAATVETHWDRDAAYYAVPWRGTWQGERGGAVLSHAIHNHDLICRILGPVDTVSAMLATRVNEIEVEDCGAISLTMTSGALVTSSITLGAAGNTSRFRVCFEGFDAESGPEPYAPCRDGWSFTARAPLLQQRVDDVLASVAAPKSGYAGFFEAFADAMDGKGASAVTLDDGRRSIELVTAIYQSARSGSPVALPIGDGHPLYDGWLPGDIGGATAASAGRA